MQMYRVVPQMKRGSWKPSTSKLNSWQVLLLIYFITRVFPCFRMLEDRAHKFTRRTGTRKRLEEDWVRASLLKRDKLDEDKIRALSPGILLHEQCDKYNRCGQCKRVVKNCGESNLWSESRYIPGSRLMV